MQHLNNVGVNPEKLKISLKSNSFYNNVYFLGKTSTKNTAVFLDFDQITTKYTTAGCGGCDLYELCTLVIAFDWCQGHVEIDENSSW